MPKLYNTITKKFNWMSDTYVGQFPFETEEVAASKGIFDPEAEVAVEGYKVDPVDADNDGYIQDGTPFERPVGTEMTVEEQKEAVSDTPKPKKPRKNNK